MKTMRKYFFNRLLYNFFKLIFIKKFYILLHKISFAKVQKTLIDLNIITVKIKNNKNTAP